MKRFAFIAILALGLIGCDSTTPTAPKDSTGSPPVEILDVTLVTFGLTVDGAKQIEAIPIGSGEMWSQTLEDFKYLCKHWQRSREITYHPPKPYLAAAHICKVERRKT